MSTTAAPVVRLREVAFDPFGPGGEDVAATAPTTDAQREIWSATLFGRDATLAYNEANVLRLSGELDVAALRTALNEVVRRHESLRATFSDDGAVLCVRAPEGLELPLVDLSALGPAEREECFAAICAEAVEVPFDLANGPLFRGRLVRLTEREHVLILSAHHVVCDGWSTSVLLEELAAVYSASTHQESAGLPPAPRFTEYARDQASASADARRNADRAYWLEQLGRGVQPLDLPTTGPRPPVRTHASRRIDFELSAEVVDRLRRLGARCGCSVFVTLLSGFAVFLGRLAGQEELVIGVPAAGQSSLEGQRSLVGHCVRTLPVLARFGAEEPLMTVMARLRGAVLGAFEHQACTFGSLLEHLPMPRDPSRLPLVSVLFNLDQAISEQALRWEGVEAEFSTIPRRYENFELFVNAVERRGRMVLECQFNTDLFAEETLRRWLEGFAVLLDAAANHPEQPVGILPMVGPTDAAAIASINATEARYPDSSCVHDLVEAQADRTPTGVAIDADIVSLTYEELERRANRLAHRLRSLGLPPGGRVGLAVDRSANMVIALLAVLKAGGAYVPLDLAFPRDRVAFIVGDARLELLVTQRSLEQALPEHEARVVYVDDETLLNESSSRLEPRCDPSSVAYVIYTSGSTGTPKGVEIPHRAVVNFLSSMAREPGMSSSDVLLAVTTLSFDIAVLELLLPLAVGARVVLASRSVAADGRALLAAIRERGVTVVQATPSTWRLLIAAGWTRSEPLKVLSGGEALPATLARELASRSDDVWNMYGPTETTVWSTLYRLPAALPSSGVVPIGRPVANTQVHVLDARLQPVPVGVRGELCIGGFGLALGYVGRPELTRERFVACPGRESIRVYRTGDIVRMRPDGALEYLGRNDAQVKLRGHRIELGEVEAALAKHENVSQAAAKVKERGEGDARLVAYFVPRARPAPTEVELRAHLRLWLPDFMLPQQFLALDALPLTPNGKIDRKALPAVSQATGADESLSYVPPRTPAEQLLADAWQEALGVGRISVHDDLFRLGAHSLLAAQVVARMARKQGVTLPLLQVFQTPTVAKLAEAWECAASKPPGMESTIPRRGPGTTRQSMMQQRLWFLEQMDPGLNVFNLPSAYRISGRLDADALERSLDAIVMRHEALRTTLAFQGEVPVQVIADRVTASIARVDLSALPAADREAEALRRIQEEANAPFDLSRGPLFRASLYRLSDEHHVFFFMPHHAIWDGWSFDVFMRELDTHYAAIASKVRPEVSEEPIQYGDFAEWHQSWLQGEELARQSAYWTAKLQGNLGPLEIPADRPRPARRTGRGGFEPFRMSSGQCAALVEVARSCGATPFMLFLAAFCSLLHRLTDQDDLVVGAPVRGRSQPETENVLGFFVNTLALRIDASGSPSFRELLLRVRTTCIEAFANPDMPFELLVRKLDAPRDLSRTPVFQAFFSFQDATSRRDSLGELSLTQLHVMPDAAPTDLTLWLMHRKEGLVGGLSYSTDLFEPSSARRMLDELRVVLAAVALDVDQPVSRLPILSEPERTLLHQCNETRADYDTSACVHALVAKQAAATPHAIGVADESGAGVTYGEIVARARQIALKLRELGAGRGARVGICVERSALLPAALLGVLEAGAAYVPLDPSFPDARLSFMASDAKLAALVTSAELSDRVATDAPRLVLDRSAPTGTGTPGCVHEGAQPDDPAYVIYTSGSTGTPKGVVVPHRAVANFLASMARAPGLSASDVLVAVTTLSFDIAGLEIFLPLVRGARVVIASRETASNGPALLSLLRRVGATILQATPSTWRMLVDAGWSANDSIKALSGGEALPLDLARTLSERAREAWNLYGPTETTIWSTAWRIPASPDRVLIGGPIANTQCHVLDGRGLEVPIGVLGELCIGGDGVTLGYLGRPEQTAERFVVDPFAGSGRTMYKTGDIVRRLPTGELEYVGRNDHQVKLRGYRIELGEIEARLGEHPAIADACAAVRTRAGGDAYLVAYYTLRPGHSVTTTDLRKGLRGSLPEYMVPQAFAELRQLPRTLNGKVDRRALPEPFGTDSGLPGAVAPRTDNERLVARVWCDLIGRREVGVHDNFFDVGGHSLLVLKAISRIADETGARVGPRSFVVDTLEQLAAQLPASRAPGASEDLADARTPGLLGRLRQRLVG